MSNQQKEHFWYILLFVFNWSAKAIEAAQEICEVYGEELKPHRIAQNWYKQFKDHNFTSKTCSVPDAPFSSKKQLNQLIHKDPCWMWKMAEIIECSHSTTECPFSQSRSIKSWTHGFLHALCFERQLQESASHDLYQFPCPSLVNSWSQAVIPLLNFYWQQKIVPMHQSEAAQRMA